MEKDINSIASYKQTVTELAQDLIKLETYAEKLEMDNCKASLSELNERIKQDRFNLAVLGEFRRGKSTLINALLRTPVLPSDVVPCTASVNRITYDPQPRAHVEFLNGDTQDIDITELAEYATQEGGKSAEVKEVTVWYPTVYCSNNVDIYDTPGLNDSEEMTQATNEVIARMDVALFVLSANVNFSMSECEFISNRLLTSEVGRVIFVVTRMDEYTEREREKILNSIRRRIGEMVLPKAAQVLADDPEKLETFKSKLGDIQVYGVSSTMALKARADHDMALLEQSGFMDFERAIDRLLTQERGRVMLDKQTGSILKSSNDIYNIIQTRVAPLTFTEEQFQEKCKEAEGEIKAIQTAMDEECKRLDDARQEIVRDVAGEWDGYVAEMKQNIRQVAQNLTMTRMDVKEANRQQFIESVWTQQMQPVVSQQIHAYSERIAEKVNEAARQECKKMESYADKVAEHMNRILNITLPDESANLSGTIGNALLNYMTFGGGSVIRGYKTAGMKGAIVGGLTGSAITFGTAVLTGAALGLLGIVATPALVVGGLVASMAGVIGGSSVVKRVFWKDRADKLKEEIANAGCAALDETLKEADVKAGLLNYVRETFDALKNQVRANTEGTIADLRKTLQNTRVNFAGEKAQAEQMAKDYSVILENLSAITDHARGVREAYRLDCVEAD